MWGRCDTGFCYEGEKRSMPEGLCESSSLQHGLSVQLCCMLCPELNMTWHWHHWRSFPELLFACSSGVPLEI